MTKLKNIIHFSSVFILWMHGEERRRKQHGPITTKSKTGNFLSSLSEFTGLYMQKVKDSRHPIYRVYNSREKLKIKICFKFYRPLWLPERICKRLVSVKVAWKSCWWIT